MLIDWRTDDLADADLIVVDHDERLVGPLPPARAAVACNRMRISANEQAHRGLPPLATLAASKTDGRRAVDVDGSILLGLQDTPYGFMSIAMSVRDGQLADLRYMDTDSIGFDFVLKCNFGDVCELAQGERCVRDLLADGEVVHGGFGWASIFTSIAEADAVIQAGARDANLLDAARVWAACCATQEYRMAMTEYRRRTEHQ